ncbi:MAG: hypothetical protein RLZZ46_1451 [Bacteroidota bacterium]|jgi:hypothetical protein
MIQPSRTEYNYKEYRTLINELLERGMTTGTDQSEAKVKYARLNVSRMNRIDKTISILPELQLKMQNLQHDYEWMVITEGWCGDASQSVPVMAAIAACSERVKLSILLRDEYPEVMDQYLTGTSRSIPILVMKDLNSGADLCRWGPRPKELSELVSEWKQSLDHDSFVEKIHAWYAKDKGFSQQREILELLSSLPA